MQTPSLTHLLSIDLCDVYGNQLRAYRLPGNKGGHAIAIADASTGQLLDCFTADEFRLIMADSYGAHGRRCINW